MQLTLDSRILGIPRTASSTSLQDEDASNSGNADDEEFDYYNPEMVEVQRIISCNTIETSHAQAKRPQDLLSTKRKRKADIEDAEEADPESEVRYLVKWRGLSYDECTWERWEELKDWYSEVWLFWRTQRPPRNLAPPQPKPLIQDYKKLDSSPVFGETKIPELLTDNEGVGGGLMLRDYQLEGVNWLLWNWWHKRSCILADEMGLGKFMIRLLL
ncbi:hypothetical protein EON65_27490 [archaeon]|nr:MAG: hypothetical protein EON65_27490 [archaeon]